MNAKNTIQSSTRTLFAMVFVHSHPNNVWNNNAHSSIVTLCFTFISSSFCLTFSNWSTEYIKTIAICEGHLPQKKNLRPTLYHVKLCGVILWSLPAKMCQSHLSLLISHKVHERILMSAFRWLVQKKWYE